VLKRGSARQRGASASRTKRERRAWRAANGECWPRQHFGVACVAVATVVWVSRGEYHCGPLNLNWICQFLELNNEIFKCMFRQRSSYISYHLVQKQYSNILQRGDVVSYIPSLVSDHRNRPTYLFRGEGFAPRDHHRAVATPCKPPSIRRNSLLLTLH
jgi:hypothetical protein